MSEREPAGGCQVSLLVPHPTRIAVLVADDRATVGISAPPSYARLPTLRVGNAEPSLTEILASVDVVDPATTAVLRLVQTSAAEVGDGTHTEPSENSGPTLLVEFDAATTAAPDGWTWQDLDAGVIAGLEPETSRVAVASWVRERAECWSPLRPAWSHPVWLERAATWMVEQVAADGRAVLEAPRQHQLWNLSVVLRVAAADGEIFFFKCSAEAFRREAVVTRSLAVLMPDYLPQVIAVDDTQGWMLMRDLGAVALGDQDESLWHEGLVAHAEVQRSWLGRNEELVRLGLPVRSLPHLALQVEEMTEDTVFVGRMPPDLRARWLATAPSLAESCRRLNELGPDPTLVHGDFHPWNVVLGPGGTRAFDWTDAAVSHPFVDLATYVLRTPDLSLRRRLLDAYVDVWSTVVSKASLREAAGLGLVVGALYQVQTYLALLPTLTGNGADDGLAGADLDWISRSLALHQHRADRLTDWNPR